MRLCVLNLDASERNLPSGRVIMYQGYEDRSIRRQLLIHTEDQISFNAELAIPWIKKNGKRGSYFPDIVIPGEKRLIEVKSVYTFTRGIADGTLPGKLAGSLAAGWSATVEVWDAVGDAPLFEIDALDLVG